MAHTRFSLSRITLFLILLALPMAAFAADIATTSAAGTNVQWQVSATGYDHVVLRISSPSGEVSVMTFRAGQAPSINLADLGSGLEEGTYTYELQMVQRVSATLRKQLEAARAAGDDAAARKLMSAAGLREPQVQTGGLTVLNGMVVTPGQIEPQRTGGRQVTTNANRPNLTPVTNDQVIPDDLIVQGSLCVGFDCVNNESFGFDTIRMKENNTRVKFEDTSVGTFPTNDWQLTANDSASGGSSKFSIEDITGAKVPFTVTAGASTNSIFVDSTGRVGFRTSTPVLDLHVKTSNTPAIRLEQDNSGGFTAQTWDIAGNEANFFVRDVTSGSRLPFRIRPGAPTSSVDISADGDVGIGTASPDEKFHVEENVNENTILVVENTNTGDTAAGVVRAKSDAATVNFQSHGSGRNIVRFGEDLGSWNEMLVVSGNGLIIGTNNATPIILGTNGTNRLEISSTGAVTIPGSLTVTGTKNFGVVDPADSSKAIYFSALEGPEAGTYYRGTAKTVNGEAVIKMPGHFARMTENERMTVQLTPVGAPGQLYVASRTPEQIVIRVAEGVTDVEFDYLVQGVRRGYLDFQVERENDLN